MDDIILEFAKTDIDPSKNRFFIAGEPKAILMVEFFDESVDDLKLKASDFIEQLKSKNPVHAHRILYGAATDKACDLRKADLSLLRNQAGDLQPVNLIEDCGVDVEDLPDYIDEVEALLEHIT